MIDEASAHLSLAAFRTAFEYFLLNFHTGGGNIADYKESIRELVFQPFEHDFAQAFETNTENFGGCPYQGSAGILKLDLDHFRMPHWLPGSRSKMGGKEYEEPEMTELRKWCESLHDCFRLLPLKYLPTAELVVRDVFILLQYLLKSGINDENEAPNAVIDDGRYSIQKLMDEVASRGVDRVLNDIPWARPFVQKLLPFQIEFIYRGGPIALSIRNLKSSQIERLIVVPGIVVQASKPYLKAQVLLIQCKDCGARKILKVPTWKQGIGLPRTCEGGGGGSGANGNVSALEGGTGASSGNRCSLDPFVIVSEGCRFVDVQTVKIQELPDDVPTGDIPRHLMLNLPNGLVNRVSAGSRILVCGVYAAFDKGGSSKDGNSAVDRSVRTAYVHVLGLEELADCALLQGQSVPRSIVLSTGLGFQGQELESFRHLASQPNIVELITASIAPSIHGGSDIKKAVACMLFGGSRKFLADGSSLRGDIHLLLLGDPSTAKSQILKFVERISPIAIYTSGKGSSAAGLTAALVRDNHGNYALEGGAMVLADGGIVCIDEFDKMRDDDRVAIHEAMEQQTISIAKAGINTVLATQCGVLAAANPTFGCYDDTKDASEQHNFEATILSRFDCIWLVRDERDEEKDRSIARHVFSLYSANANTSTQSGEGPIPSALLRSYIAYCRANSHPRLSAESAKRLENFYVEVREACRSSTKSRKDQIPISVRQLESLVRLTESFAKMSLASSASLEHVEEAIRLFKMSTVATAQSSTNPHIASPEDVESVKRIEEALLQRLAIGARASKATIIRDLRLRNFEPRLVAKAITILIQRGVLEARGDAVVQRTGIGSVSG